jgi:RNA polymerase sigma-70 factor (ECF subfamily)
VERSLVIQAQSGDRAAFNELAAGIGDRLFAVACRILRDPDLAEDAAQQTIITIWRNLRQLRDPDRFEAWAYQALIRDCHRRARRARFQSADVNEMELRDSARDMAVTVADRDQLERGFRRLTPDQRSVIVLRHYLGYTLTQIADIVGTPVGTVGSRLHAAKRALRAALEADTRPGHRKDASA